MNSQLKKVAAFHKLFSQPIGEGVNSVEPLKTRQLRLKLIFEELAEYAEASDTIRTFNDLCFHQLNSCDVDAIKDGDAVSKIEQLDSLCDITYVVNGSIITAGLQEVFDENYDKVHHNNMSKAHVSKSHAEETASQNPGSSVVEVDGKFLVYNSSGKVTKPWNHEKVKLTLFP